MTTSTTRAQTGTVGTRAADAGSMVRIGLLHHVTCSINSICHAIGERPFTTCDKSANVWRLAILSMGESWHNRPDLRPPRRRPWPTRQQRPHHLGLGEAGLGLWSPLAASRTPRRQATPVNRPEREGLPSDMMTW